MAFRGGAVVLLGLCMLYPTTELGTHPTDSEGQASYSEWTDVWGEESYYIKLILQLTTTHHPLVIPPRMPVNVTYGLDLSSIDSVNEKENIMRISVYAEMKWVDPRAQWEPSNFGGIVFMDVPPDKLWYPDIRPHAQILEKEEVSLRVHFDGTIYHYPQMRLAVPCAMHFAYYPFDTQRCTLNVESWKHDASVINLTLPEGPLEIRPTVTKVLPNPEWQVQEFTAARHEDKYPCCNGLYHSLAFSMIVKRQAQEYTVRVLAPSVVTSLLILLCFLIPPHCGERILFVSILLLCILLQLFQLNLTVPIRGPDAPYLADFLCFSVFLAFFAVVESVLSLNLSRGVRGNSNGEEFITQTKTNMGMTRIARFIDIGCFMVFTFIFAVAGGVILNPNTEFK
ncbi:neuronal acetylcholine receptor subunit alpha-3-like [Acanthaster planci]|uniref:Neuronal acetylcholine receptor subunit alpha-3-like n=1 Tax=Acanthaster planci TaxID=133434 RepID=A0A8B7ZYN4_ACAPL|nr:neuronal acetylcholine receptor subunit alpha-3-like [Acanthaster planci]